jgi:type VI protein secretion system component VasK
MSTVIYGLLEEEKERNLEMQAIHQREIDSLPKGSIYRRRVGDSKNMYHYLSYRENGKTIAKYLGKDEELITETRKKIAKRKHLEKIVKRLKLEYTQICKIVKE